jgi:heme O synthase-like polyprenyltransferase
MKDLLLGGIGTTSVAGTLGDMSKLVNTAINAVIGVCGGVMVLLAIYLAYKFMTADDEGKRKNAKGQLIYAIIGILVVVVILVLWNTVVKGYLDSSKGSGL